MRPREPALIDRLRDIVEVMSSTGIPVVANGDCLGYLDADRVRQLTGRLPQFVPVPTVAPLWSELTASFGRRIRVHDRSSG